MKPKRATEAMLPAEYLKRPYARIVTPEDDGSFRGEIMEFPGCIATGDTPSEALSNLEGAAESWLQAAIASGQRIPEPMEESGFSGKLILRIPKSLHRKAARQAAREGVSLNQFIATCIAEQVGARRRGQSSAEIFTSEAIIGRATFEHKFSRLAHWEEGRNTEGLGLLHRVFPNLETKSSGWTEGHDA